MHFPAHWFLHNALKTRKTIKNFCSTEFFFSIVRWGAHLYMSLFLSVCLTICLSVCPSVFPSVHCAQCLRNRTSPDHNFWYTYVKWWYLWLLFSCFQNFDFLGCYGGKRAKNSPKWEMITSVMHHISGMVHHLIIIFGMRM